MLRYLYKHQILRHPFEQPSFPHALFSQVSPEAVVPAGILSHSQTPDGEAQRKDDQFSYVAAWEYKGDNQPEVLHKEELLFENVKLTQRSYK